MKTTILAFLCALSSAFLASGQVPSLINYQGRLTDANGAAVTGSKNFSINIFDAATGGNLLYSETIGAVTLDSNGVYSFQFGSAGTSNTQVTETIGTTAGTTLVYSKALANSSVVNNSITVTDGTNSWSQSVGNPGSGATATANTIVGFVIGATITNGGSGYTSAPTVTISGNGTGAAATATMTDGVVTGINVTSAGSGYTTGATITIAPPVIPFRVEYSSGTITATYASAPTAGRTIAATYRYGTGGITSALAEGAEHWMAVSVNGTPQATRQRVLAVPFAQRAASANTAEFAEDSFARQQISEFMTSFSSNKILTLGKSLVSSSNFAGGLVQATVNQSFGANNLGTKEIAPNPSSSTKASKFVVEQSYSNGAQSTYEIQYSNSAPVTGSFVSTGSFLIENPKPNDNVAVFRCSIPSGFGGSNISMRIFTPEDCVANFSISPFSTTIKRGAIVVYSSGDSLLNTQLVVGFSNGSSITTTSGVFFDFPATITNISVRTKSVGMNASISEIKLLY
jgi:hypothetical protein